MKVLGAGHLIKSYKGRKSTEQYAISRHPMYKHVFCVCTCVCLCACVCVCVCVCMCVDTNQLNTSHSQRLNSGKPLGTGRCDWWCSIDPCSNESLSHYNLCNSV